MYNNSDITFPASIIKRGDDKYVIEYDITGKNVVEEYKIGRILGKGGFATVYELYAKNANKTLAGKVVKKSELNKPKLIEKFKSEIKIHMSLDHENICKMYKHLEDRSNHFLILELCSCNTLSHLLKTRKYLSEPETQYFLMQIIKAVQYLHSKRVIHRDLKLGNIFLDKNLNVKIGDLGLAAELNEPNERKKTMCGTPNYIAPEVLDNSGHRAYSYEVDIWAIGVIAYTLLIGRSPFDGGDVKKTYDNIRGNMLIFPSDMDHCISRQARMFIRSILALDPGARLTLTQMLQHPFFRDISW